MFGSAMLTSILQAYAQHNQPQPAGSSAASVQPHMSSIFGTTGPAAPAQQAGVNVETLSNDIHNLIIAMKGEASQNPHDASIQNRLKALLDLQRIVQSTSLPQDQLELIKNQVTELAAVTLRASSAHNQIPAVAQPPPSHHLAAPTQVRQPSPSSVAPPQPPQASGQAPITLDGLLGQGALAALMARTTSQNSTPNPPPNPQVAVRSPQPTQAAPFAAPPAQAQQPLSLIEQLRQAGLMPSQTPTNTSAAPTPPPAAPPLIPANIASILAAHKASSAAGQNGTQRGQIDSASLKHT